MRQPKYDYNLKLPVELYEQIKKFATENEISFNKAVEVLCERGLKDDVNLQK